MVCMCVLLESFIFSLYYELPRYHLLCSLVAGADVSSHSNWDSMEC